MFIGVCTCNVTVLVSATPFWDKVIRGNSGFTFQTFVKQYEVVIFPPFLEVFHFNSARMLVMLPSWRYNS